MFRQFMLSLAQLLGWVLATALMTLMPVVTKILSLMTVVALTRCILGDTPATWPLGLFALLLLAKSYPPVVRKLLSINRKEDLTTKKV